MEEYQKIIRPQQQLQQQQRDEKENADADTHTDTDTHADGFVHFVSTRFMQYQPNLLSLGRARVYQFETFCVPTMVHQTSQNFVWLIRTDPQLATTILDHLKRILQPYPNFFLLLDNNNTIHEFTPYRDLFQHHHHHNNNNNEYQYNNNNKTTILTGSIPLLRRHVELSKYVWNLETVVDSDDGLHETFIEKIQHRARKDRSKLLSYSYSYSSSMMKKLHNNNNPQQQQQNSTNSTNTNNIVSVVDIVDPTKDRIQYLYCATTGISWLSSTMSDRVPYDPTQPNTTINTPPGGILRPSVPQRRKKNGQFDYGMCLQLGLTYMLSPALPKRLSIPHNEIHTSVRRCSDVLLSPLTQQSSSSDGGDGGGGGGGVLLEGLKSTMQAAPAQWTAHGNGNGDGDGDDNDDDDKTFETTMRCLNWLGDDNDDHAVDDNGDNGSSSSSSSMIDRWPQYQTLRSRAVTSDGMGGFHKAWDDDPNSIELRSILYNEFHVPPQLVEESHSFFRSHQLRIMKDNIAGQCTPFEPRGPTCKQDYPTKTLNKYMAEVERKENEIIKQHNNNIT